MKKFLLLLCLMLCTAFTGRSSTVTIDGINYEFHSSSDVKNRYYTVVSASKYLTGDIVLAENLKDDGRDYPVRFQSFRRVLGDYIHHDTEWNVTSRFSR